jgi:hypothetical protein
MPHCHQTDHEMLHEVLRRTEWILKLEGKIMTTQAEFDASLDALIAAEAARDAAVTQALNDLMAKVAAGNVNPTDFAAELAKVATLQTNAANITAQASADDPGPTVVPVTPAP